MYATIDDTPALKYAWTRAHLRQLLLRMLEMDETLAQLRQSNLPAFAAHLSLAAPLQPRQATALDSTVLGVFECNRFHSVLCLQFRLQASVSMLVHKCRRTSYNRIWIR
jgi:hypothetical protein